MSQSQKTTTKRVNVSTVQQRKRSEPARDRTKGVSCHPNMTCLFRPRKSQIRRPRSVGAAIVKRLRAPKLRRAKSPRIKKACIRKRAVNRAIERRKPVPCNRSQSRHPCSGYKPTHIAIGRPDQCSCTRTPDISGIVS